MEANGVIETSVDKLVALVRERGRVELKDVSKELGISRNVIQEWVDFLEDEGTIDIEYKLTNAYLVDRKLTKKEIELKEKECNNKKDILIRRAEGNLSLLAKNTQEFNKIKEEFDRLKNELGLQLEVVRQELSELEQYQKTKATLEQQVEEQKKRSKVIINDLANQISVERTRYKELMSNIESENNGLKKQKLKVRHLEKSLKKLNKKLMITMKASSMVEKEFLSRKTVLENSELRIQKLSKLAEELNISVKDKQSLRIGSLEKTQQLERQAMEIHAKALKTLLKNKKNVSDAKILSRKFTVLLEKRLGLLNLVDRIDNGRHELQKDLTEFIRKAKSLQLTKRNGQFWEQIVDLEKRFHQIGQKKNVLQGQIKKLISLYTNQ